MDWKVTLALMVAIPVVLFPAALVWYMNASGLYRALRPSGRKGDTSKKRLAGQKVKSGE